MDSNKEHGEGRSDVVVCDTINGRVAIFEAKRAMTLGDLDLRVTRRCGKLTKECTPRILKMSMTVTPFIAMALRSIKNAAS